MKKFRHIMIISVLALLLCFEAAASTFAPSLAQLLRINTGAQISVVLAADETAAQSGEGDVVSVRSVDGSVLYERVSALVTEGGENYPYLSGVNMSLEVSESSGVRTEKLTAMTTEEGKFDTQKTYTVALSAAADRHFEDCEKIAAYSADNASLYNYLSSFAPYDEGAEVEAEAAEAEAELDGKTVIAKQGDILMLTITVFLIVLIIYLFIRKKKKQG